MANLGQQRYGDAKIFTERWAARPKTAQTVYDAESNGAIFDATGVCKWARLVGMTTQDFSELLTAATGEVFTAEDLVETSHRGFALERAYNAREGIRRIDDYPFSLRWQLEHGEPHPLFTAEETPITLKDYDTVLDEYYRLNGYDLQTGIPLRPKLEELGLKDVADDLENRKILQEATR